MKILDDFGLPAWLWKPPYLNPPDLRTSGRRDHRLAAMMRVGWFAFWCCQWLNVFHQRSNKWVWVNTYRYIFSGMNIHLPAILGVTRYQGFDPSPNSNNLNSHHWQWETKASISVHQFKKLSLGQRTLNKVVSMPLFCLLYQSNRMQLQPQQKKHEQLCFNVWNWNQIDTHGYKNSGFGPKPIVTIFAGWASSYTSYLDVHWPIAIQFGFVWKRKSHDSSSCPQLKLPVGAYHIFRQTVKAMAYHRCHFQPIYRSYKHRYQIRTWCHIT